METELSSAPYFHGALMDQDVNTLLINEGDFLLQTRHQAGATKPRLVLAIKTKSEVKRMDIKRAENTIKVNGKIFSSLREMVKYFSTEEPIVFPDGDKVSLKKPVAKGKFQLTHNDVRLIKKIGSGAYGTVYRGSLLRDKTTVAVKRLDTEGTDEQGLAEMMKEARVMQLYDHKNIVKFYGFIVDRMPYLLVMEYCDGGSVEDKLRSQGKKIKIATRVDMCAQAACGLEYLHSKECIHRDIATRNCLLDGRVVKMADFGMCRATSVYKVDLSKPLNVRWLAPEVWKNGETRYNTDIYAFGVMLWEMFEIPYDSPYSEWKAGIVKQQVMSGYRMAPQSCMPAEVAAVMALAWHHSADKRPNATELRKMLEDVKKNFNAEVSTHSQAISHRSRA